MLPTGFNNKSHSTLMICAGFSLLVHIALLFSNPSGQSQTIISKQTPGGFLVRLIKAPDNPKQLKQNKQRQQNPIEKAHVQTPLPPQLTHNKKSLSQQGDLHNILLETEMRSKVITNLTHQFQQFFYYPRLARRHNWQGQVTLGFSINDNGFIQNIRVTTSSGYNVLDEAAITAMNRIPKLKKDANLPEQGMDMELPILYQLTKG